MRNESCRKGKHLLSNPEKASQKFAFPAPMSQPSNDTKEL